MIMVDGDWLTEQFQQHRSQLYAVAYRMLGSVADSEDALQEAWLRIRDQDPDSIANMRAWLTTVVGRVCLNMLRSRRARPEVLSETHMLDPVVTLADGADSADPEDDVILADSIGPALLLALDALSPAERFSFVLHDIFGVRFAEIATALDRSEAAVQKLASRARQRVRTASAPNQDLSRQRRLVTAFFAAAREGNFEALLEVLHPDVVLRIDGGVLRADASLVLHGAAAVSRHTAGYARLFPLIQPAIVNGAAGAVVITHHRLFAVMGFTIIGDRITRIDALLDPERLAQLRINGG
jgi:RNA polymerase sigma-70 factor (ECF subfamily)